MGVAAVGFIDGSSPGGLIYGDANDVGGITSGIYGREGLGTV